MNKVTHLVIDRTRWLRGVGQDSGQSYLQRDCDGMRCCLGFYALAVGFAEDGITNRWTPAELVSMRDGAVNPIPELVEHDHGPRPTAACCKLMAFNDAAIGEDANWYYDRDQTAEFRLGSEKEREELITEAFRQIGVTVEFIN